MGRFAGLGGIRTNSGGVFFKDGEYLVELGDIKFFKSRDKKDTFVVETVVEESSNPERGPGSKPSQVVKIDPQYAETHWGNIKQFVAAALEIENPDAFVPPEAELLKGEDLEEAMDRFWEETLEFIVSDEQPLKGTKIRLSVATIKTKSNKDFSKHVWGPVVEAVAA